MKNNLLYIVFDSCRFDSFVAANTPNISRLGTVEKRYAFASWTIPSHTVYMMGASPHKNPRGVFASEVYKKDFYNWSTRLGIPDVNFANFIPQLSLPAYLQESGYKTNALVSMPVLNPLTNLNKHFDRYELMDKYDDFNAIIDSLKFEKGVPQFYLLNIGETHYPYTIAGEEAGDLLRGPKGVFRHTADGGSAPENSTVADDYYFMDHMRELQNKQISNIGHLDKLFAKLYDVVPENTHIIVTSDHGELFGEEGFFGHGPVFHGKVFEVFFLEGKIK